MSEHGRESPPSSTTVPEGERADRDRVYVMLDIYQLQNKYLSLRERTRSLRAKGASTAEAEGYELREKSDAASASQGEVSEQQVALKKEWRSWQLASLKNVYVCHASGVAVILCGADGSAGTDH